MYEFVVVSQTINNYYGSIVRINDSYREHIINFYVSRSYLGNYFLNLDVHPNYLIKSSSEVDFYLSEYIFPNKPVSVISLEKRLDEIFNPLLEDMIATLNEGGIFTHKF